MNDDRKFRERAEIMKELLLARIPTDVIAKIACVSESTIAVDRSRVAKLYRIKIPSANVTSLGREERFRILLKTYLTVNFETYEWNNPLYQAAKLLIDFDRIENHIDSLGRFYEELQYPQFPSDDPISKNYQQLIEDCLNEEHCYFTKEFYKAIYSGTIPYENFRNENDLIGLATKFYLDKNRSSINTLVINDPKAIVDPLLSALTEVHATALKEKYGLDGPKKTPDESGKDHGLSRERIRQIREKALNIFRNELFEKKYLIHSTAKYEHLEKQYAELDEKYKSYCKETDQEILNLNAEISRLNGEFEDFNETFNPCGNPRIVAFLIKPIRDFESELPIRVLNCLYDSDYKYTLDVIENWKKMILLRNFGKKCYMAIDDCFLSHGIDRSKITKEDKISARQLIKREELIKS